MSEITCPPLEVLLRRAAAHRRRGRLAAGAAGGCLLASAAVIALECVRFAVQTLRDPPMGHVAIVATGVALGLGAVLVAAVAALRAPDETSVARDLDRRLELADLAATTLALVRGRVASPLAAYVAAQATTSLDAAVPRVDPAYAAGVPAARLARRAVLLALLACALVVALFLLDWFRGLAWPAGLLGRGPRDVGIVAQHDPSKDRPVPAGRGGAPGDDAPPGGDPKHDPGARAAAPRPPEKKDPPDAQEPDVRVKARPSRESFRERDPVLVVVSAVPTRDLPRDRSLALTIELDGVEAPTHAELRVGSAAPQGVGEIQDLRRIPALADRVGPGEHTVRARLRDTADGTTYASEPAKFRVESDDPGAGGGGGGGAEPPPPPAESPPPRGAPPPPPPPQTPNPPEPPPPAPGDETSPKDPQGAPPPSPEVPVKLDPQVVVPLFGQGEEVAKKGPLLVLVPGGGKSDAPTRPAPLDEVLPDAARRAERDVDRAGVRAEDRELVRRYFDALRRALR